MNAEIQLHRSVYLFMLPFSFKAIQTKQHTHNTNLSSYLYFLSNRIKKNKIPYRLSEHSFLYLFSNISKNDNNLAITCTTKASQDIFFHFPLASTKCGSVQWQPTREHKTCPPDSLRTRREPGKEKVGRGKNKSWMHTRSYTFCHFHLASEKKKYI